MEKVEEFKRKNKQLTELCDLIDNAAKEISDFMHTDIPFQKYTDLSISAVEPVKNTDYEVKITVTRKATSTSGE